MFHYRLFDVRPYPGGAVVIGVEGNVLSRDERMRQIASTTPPAPTAGAREDVSTRVHGEATIGFQ
ncbi:MAG: hypothetical protein OEW19_11540 [Acidobacteriota bacterium]|nr:hypothetical protein [Acidobacteriota bacterium]